MILRPAGRYQSRGGSCDDGRGRIGARPAFGVGLAAFVVASAGRAALAQLLAAAAIDA